MCVATLFLKVSVGGIQGGSYSWTDTTANGMIYYYWLEEIAPDGSSTLHGPVQAQPQVPTAVTISDVRNGSRRDLGLPLIALGGLLMVAGLLLRRRIR